MDISRTCHQFRQCQVQYNTRRNGRSTFLCSYNCVLWSCPWWPPTTFHINYWQMGSCLDTDHCLFSHSHQLTLARAFSGYCIHFLKLSIQCHGSVDVAFEYIAQECSQLKEIVKHTNFDFLACKIKACTTQVEFLRLSLPVALSLCL